MTKEKGCDNLTKLSRETTMKIENSIEFQEPSLKEREQNKKFLKKLLTNETTHDNINELLMQTTDKQQ